MPLLVFHDLFAGYGETEILHGVSGAVDSGEIVTVIGPNGAGKSTLIKTIIGVLKPRKGSIQFRAIEIAGRSPETLVTDGLAYVPQNRNIFPSLTVRENLEMGAITRRPGWLREARELVADRLLKLGRDGGDATKELAQSRLTPEEFEARVKYIAEIFPNLRPKLRQRAGALSGGEQQMVALGKALVLDPVLLLIDEPSAGLAPKLVHLIFDKIQEINDRGTAILLVEQNAKKALSMADRGYVLEMGRNRYEGKGEALLLDPEVGRLYLGG
ncbi:MAG TPA: ABC transporter ATP-binding protein [Thermoplasmata archaeon]|nr:ABC transporter ATP-binding protein [Thermoplasmata archaeon]